MWWQLSNCSNTSSLLSYSLFPSSSFSPSLLLQGDALPARLHPSLLVSVSLFFLADLIAHLCLINFSFDVRIQLLYIVKRYNKKRFIFRCQAVVKFQTPHASSQHAPVVKRLFSSLPAEAQLTTPWPTSGSFSTLANQIAFISSTN